MTTTIVQKVVARCRQDFSSTSATAVLITGTQRLLTVTAGNYVDLTGTVAAAIATGAADAFLNIYVDGAIAGEGGACSIGTAGDKVQLAAQVRIGPITAAQAAAGILVDLRVASSANALTVTAATTPSEFGAVLTATELTISDEGNLPTQIPHCLLWLKADAGVTKASNGEVTAWTNNANSGVLAYDGGTGNFTAGLVVTGGSSLATGRIQTVVGTTAGTLVLTDVRGTFVNNEALTDTSTGAADSAAALAAITVTGAAGSAPFYEVGALATAGALFFPGTVAARLNISGTAQQGTALMVFAVVGLPSAQVAGATLMAPLAASKADCLVVTLSNATVNRNALLDTGNAGTPEYVSTTTTISAGNYGVMRWRYNVGTTTGAAGVNANAEVADTTFAPATGIAFATIGSAASTDFPLGDFRLYELIVYSFKQASTEDAVSASDVLAIRDYLNGRWNIY